MADILIRDVPDEVINAIDANARRVGLSRTEYLRRRLADERQRTGQQVTMEDLRRFSEMARDLADEDVMRRAWE
jgi:hypothetical protein